MEARRFHAPSPARRNRRDMFVGLNQTPQPLGKAKARPAFTLIELLVVIAIIAVLAALLLPALARAKAAANTTACRSNARQLAICLAMYADEYTAYPFSVDFKRQLMWYDQLTPFYENTGRVNTNPTNQNKLLLCPAYKGGSGVTVWSPNYFGYRGGSYGYNGFGTKSVGYIYFNTGGADSTLGLGGASGFVPSEPMTSDKILVPSDMIGLGDSMLMPFGDGSTGSFVLTIADGQRNVAARHNGGSNIGFCDGHVETLQNKRLVAPTYEDRRRWNNDHEPHL